MFVEAIEKAGAYTRPIFTIMRRYGSSEVIPGSATLFFVNEDGWAVTSKGVAKMILDAGTIDKKYAEFLEKKKTIPQGFNLEEGVRQLEEMYQYKQETVVQLKVNFVGCVDVVKGVQCKMHPKLDLALVHFEGFEKIGYSKPAVLAGVGSELKPGKSLCRLGFPFPEFRNYRYDVDREDIQWTKEGRATMPRFPSDGMVTRLVGSPEGIVGAEMSTPGFRGQEGGPVFDANGVVYGMYSGVSPLNFGMCIHVDRIKDFLRQEKVSYQTDKPEPEVSLEKTRESEQLLDMAVDSDAYDKLN
jgi:hypothetical protein